MPAATSSRSARALRDGDRPEGVLGREPGLAHLLDHEGGAGADLRLGAGAPPSLDRVVRTCLAKDPEERWQSAADVKRELSWIRGGSHDAARRDPPRRAWLAGLAVAALSAPAPSPWPSPCGGRRLRPRTAWSCRSSCPSGPSRTTSSRCRRTAARWRSPGSPAGSRSSGSGSSPRARCGRARDGLQRGRLLVPRRTVDRVRRARQTAQDRRRDGIHRGAGRRRGGPRRDMGLRGGDILFAQKAAGAISRVAAAGGPVTTATTLQPGDLLHRWPQFLPGGKRFSSTSRPARSRPPAPTSPRSASRSAGSFCATGRRASSRARDAALRTQRGAALPALRSRHGRALRNPRDGRASRHARGARLVHRPLHRLAERRPDLSGRRRRTSAHLDGPQGRRPGEDRRARRHQERRPLSPDGPGAATAARALETGVYTSSLVDVARDVSTPLLESAGMPVWTPTGEVYLPPRGRKYEIRRRRTHGDPKDDSVGVVGPSRRPTRSRRTVATFSTRGWAATSTSAGGPRGAAKPVALCTASSTSARPTSLRMPTGSSTARTSRARPRSSSGAFP